MSLKLKDLNPKLRERIQNQIAAEDRAKKGGGAAVGLQAAKSQPVSQSALEQGVKRKAADAFCFLIVINIIAIRKRLLDHTDNSKSAAKSLIDEICRAFDIDDGDDNVRINVGQLQTTGKEMTLVTVEYYE